MNKLFGPDWDGTPAGEELERVPVPIGELCSWCEEPFAEPDTGILMIHLAGDGTAAWRGQHRCCHLRQVFGSVSCQMGHGPGGICRGDDPALTKRQAAEAAVAFFQLRGQARN